MSEVISQENYMCEWRLDLNGNGHESDLWMKNPHASRVRLYVNDDPYYSIEFQSRARLEGFIAQLQRAAHEVWPV